MSLTVEILIIGDELLNGTIVDRNSAWFGRELARRGLTVSYRQTVPDIASDIIDAMTLAATRSSVVITSGGLGPTVDDLTASAAAEFLGEPAVVHDAALASIEARRAAVGRMLTDADKKQAVLPESATVLQNPVGTAPGFSLDVRHTRFFHFPGVPREFQKLSALYALPHIDSQHGQIHASRTWKCFGVTESQLATMVDTLPSDGLELHYRAHFPEIHLTVVAPTEAQLAEFGPQFEALAGRRIFGGRDTTFPGAVVRALKEREWTVATAESCTGGLVSKLITDAPGASAVFTDGFVTYANRAKTRWLGVPEAVLAAHGAVSQETVVAMAQGVREATGATLGVATSGIAGPGGGTPEKPVGTIHIALASAERVRHRFLRLPFDRERNRLATAYGALELIRKQCIEAASSTVETNDG